MTKCDVLIIGAGVPGLALARLLEGAGMTITLADAGGSIPPYNPEKPDGRTVALMGGSIDILTRAGIGPEIETFGSPLRRMAVVDDSRFPRGEDKTIQQVFDAQEMNRDAFGWNVPLPALRASLNKHLKDVTFLTGVKLTGLKNGVAAFDDGKTIEASVIIGADGRDSIVRTLSRIDADKRPYGQTAITCVIAHTRSHNDTSTEFHRPGGPFTLVPMQGKHCAIVWVEKDDDAQKILTLPRDAFVSALQDRTRGKLGQVSLVTNPVSWKLEYVRARTLTAPRVALAAEAAHVLSPIGAQGLNLSLRDIDALAQTLINAAQSGLDIGSDTVLASYARARRSDVASRTTAIDFTNQMVASESEALRGLRRLALRALSLPGPIRRMVMKKGLAA